MWMNLICACLVRNPNWSTTLNREPPSCFHCVHCWVIQNLKFTMKLPNTGCDSSISVSHSEIPVCIDACHASHVRLTSPWATLLYKTSIHRCKTVEMAKAHIKMFLKMGQLILNMFMISSQVTSNLALWHHWWHELQCQTSYKKWVLESLDRLYIKSMKMFATTNVWG